MGPKDLEFGLLGERLGHSFSPAIHRQLEIGRASCRERV